MRREFDDHESMSKGPKRLKMTALPPPLTQVCCTLNKVAPRVAVFSNIVDCVSSCLDISLRLTPPQAATTQNPALLERTITRVMKDTAIDPAFRSYWLARAMEVAIQKNNLMLVQQIHTIHPEPLHVDTMEGALEFGSLELIQWVIENRHDRVCCASGVQNLCPTCLSNRFYRLSEHDIVCVMEWFCDIGLPVFDADLPLPAYIYRLMNAKLLEWLEARGTELNHRILFVFAMASGNCSVLQFLLDREFTPLTDDLLHRMIMAAPRRDCQDAIDLLLASSWCDNLRDKIVWTSTRSGSLKVFQWQGEAEATIFDQPINILLACNAHSQCNVDTLEWLRAERGILEQRNNARPSECKEDPLPLYKWMVTHGVGGWTKNDVMCDARHGHFGAIQWIHEHQLHLLTGEVVDLLARYGHVEILEWIYARTSLRCTVDGLSLASRNGHLKVVQFLTQHGEGDTNSAMFNAVVHGHLEVLSWLSANRIDGCSSCVAQTVLHTPTQIVAYPESMVAPLDTLRWLSRHTSRSSSCQGHCLVSHPRSVSLALVALRSGDLDLLRYLLEEHGDSPWNHPRNHPRPVLIARTAVFREHLPLIQWLESTYPERIDQLRSLFMR